VDSLLIEKAIREIRFGALKARDRRTLCYLKGQLDAIKNLGLISKIQYYTTKAVISECDIFLLDNEVEKWLTT
jgi:hypothetical protein